MSGALADKMQQHEAFWRGEGPCLIFIPAETQELYDLQEYPMRFHNPLAMWESEMRRARALVDWPTDGIPCVRPNLGVIFVPTMLGLGYRLPEQAMPWPGEPLDRAAIQKARGNDIAASETMRLAAEFYAIHRAAAEEEVVPYHADTQGVFDIAHLLYGEALFYDLPNPDRAAWVEELLRISREFYTQATSQLKAMLEEPAGSMIHGHGTCQGVYFPTAGARSAEDTATLISPAMIEQFVLPHIAQTADAFGGLFVHFCGRHPTMLEQFCRMNAVRAIDLGNPEFYDTRHVMELCAETGTVLHSRLAVLPGETWRAYIERLATLTRDTGARVLLRPLAIPETREACAQMREYWHENTCL